MLGQVKLTTFSSDFTRTFFEEGLGAPSCDPVQVGTTQLRFQSADEKPASTWPGQLYIWVENIQDTWKKSRELSQRSGTEIVESVVCCHDERYCDALVLRDPGSANVLVVNQVPVGTSVKLAAFYERFLSAKVMQGKDGYRLRFASGDVLRQTFTFQDDESANEAWLPAQFPSEVCFYLESDAKFRIAFAKLSNAKLVMGDWSVPCPYMSEFQEFWSLWFLCSRQRKKVFTQLSSASDIKHGVSFGIKCAELFVHVLAVFQAQAKA
ncbi:GIP [Symbiodinium microadriaticum]|nr:GIP [Symbiodinium microadriaticum]